ncbi:MAG: alpha/beta fold hydrolase [Anaerolineae bacterium]|nr:alpha/beta fold hydrolase [Anaerolineae bacterium]
MRQKLHRLKPNHQARFYWPTLILIWLYLAGLSGSTFPAAPAQAHSTGQPATFEPAPCMFKGIDLGLFTISPERLGFECGYVTVPEQHAHPDGPTIRLPVAVRRVTGAAPQPDPLFLAQGGPGGSAFEIFIMTVPGTDIAAERDIVIFNQRGTVYAQPELVCTELRESMAHLLALPSAESDKLWPELLNACYQRLQAEGINLSAYNSLENAADVEAIRQALGYNEFNFYGVSYGTLLGLHLMRHHPEHLRSVILDSVVPPDLNFITSTAANENRLYNELFQFCAANPSCAASYPCLEERFLALVDQLNQAPTTLTLTHPDTGAPVAAYLDGDILREVLYQALYLSDNYAIFPKIVANLEAGNYLFLEKILPLIAFDRTFSEGMYYSVICAEDADFDPHTVNLDGLRPQIATTAADDLQSYLDSCAVWPVNLLPPAVDEPVVSNIPTLLLSGQFDPITPPLFANTAARTLKHGYNLVDPFSSHGVAFNHNCINQIVQDFLDTPTAKPNAACLNSLTPAPVVPPSAITLPLLDKVARFDAPYLVQTIIAGLFLLGVLSAFIIWPIGFLVNIILEKKPALTAKQKRLRRISRLLALVFGFTAAIFAAGLTGFVGYVLFFENTYLAVYTLPAAARPILFLPVILLPLALGLIGVTVFIWRERVGPVWSRLYDTFLAICAGGYILILAIQGLLLI